ncbi:hypothetical protein D3C77_592410 [compost metagenome]
MGCIHGLSFSSFSPGKNPISFPIGTTGRAINNFLYLCSSSTFKRPAAKANNVFPVPAFPVIVIRGMSSLSNNSSAIRCCVFRAVMPHTGSLLKYNGSSLFPSSLTFSNADFPLPISSFKIKNSCEYGSKSRFKSVTFKAR